MSSSSSNDSANSYCEITMSTKGKDLASAGGYTYVKDRNRKERYYWKCEKFHEGCPGRLITIMTQDRSDDAPPKHKIVGSVRGKPHTHRSSTKSKIGKTTSGDLKGKASSDKNDPPAKDQPQEPERMEGIDIRESLKNVLGIASGAGILGNLTGVGVGTEENRRAARDSLSMSQSEREALYHRMFELLLEFSN